MTSPQRTVLITGCTAGSIGYFLAKQFASSNYKVIATARRVSNMGDLASTSPNITLLALDVTSADSITTLKDQVKAEIGDKLDILYHNAGYRTVAMATEITLRESENIFNTNVLGIIEMNRQFADMIVAAKGVVVFTSSISAYTPHPSHAVYCASKAALQIYVRTLRIEMKPFGVRVVVVNTGGVSTAMSNQRLTLAEDSRYQYLFSKMNQVWDETEVGHMSPEKYAKYVVHKVTDSSATLIWYGNHTWTIRLVEALNMGWFYEVFFARQYGLNAKAPSTAIKNA